ncbi:MAG: hypothetical protein AYK22_02375 [Thermoplasmatales archaeon SG8-52-3]|nr:MAG: hypothetical protein AYK22_02375 [Thermoplasmatales archaeon SG8-52-3]
MEPIVIYRKNSGKLGILNGHKRFKILRLMGINELKPEMDNYNDNKFNKEILKISDIDDNIIN